MSTKENNLGGKSYVVDSITEIYPRTNTRVNYLKSIVDSTLAGNKTEQSEFARNFSLVIEGDLELSSGFEQDGVTQKHYTDITANVLYARGGHNMLVTNIPLDAYSWYELNKSEPIEKGKKTIRILETGLYRCSVEYKYPINTLEPGMENVTIPILLTTVFEIKNGTIKLYTYSNAETRDELLMDLANLSWYPDPNAITSTKKYLWRKESTDGGQTWIYFRETGLEGKPGTGGSGGGTGVIVQYQYSDSDREPPLRYIPFIFGGKLVMFKGNAIGDNDSDDWEENPVRDAKYKWMRVSTDGGKTWTYSVVTGPEPSFFELLSSKDSFRLNERGAVDKDETLRFWIIRHNMIGNEEVTWKVEPNILTYQVFNDYINVIVPKGYTEQTVKVSVKVGKISEELSKVLYGEVNGTPVPEKLPTVYSETNPPQADIFPQFLSDGVSPIKDGDFVLVSLPDDNNARYLIPYRYSEAINPSTGKITGWVPTTAEYNNHSQIMADCLQEVLASGNTVPSTSAYYGFFQSLVANDAFITFLESQYLHIKGAIYGGGYDKDGVNEENKQGFHIASNGQLKASKADISGKLACFTEQGDKIFETDSVVTDYSLKTPTPYLWDMNELCNVVDKKKKINFANQECTAYKFEKDTLMEFPTYNYSTSDTFNIAYACKMRVYITYTYNGIGGDPGLDIEIRSDKRGYLFKQTVKGKSFDRSFDIEDNEVIHIWKGTNAGFLQGQSYTSRYSLSVGQVLIESGYYNIAAFKIGEANNFTSYRCTATNFDSNNLLKYIDLSYIADSLNKNLEYGVASSTLTINGTAINPKSMLANGKKIIFILESGTRKEFEYGNTGIVQKNGYLVAGELVIKGSGLGIRVSGILPIGNADGVLGTDAKRFAGFFSNLEANQINKQNTKNKVWGSVAN